LLGLHFPRPIIWSRSVLILTPITLSITIFHCLYITSWQSCIKKGVLVTDFLIVCIYIPWIQNGVMAIHTVQGTINFYKQQFVNTTQH
jgi:hypothetical protein